jgi:hypothetical protein
MENSNDKSKTALITIDDKYALTAEGAESLNKESMELINQIIAENDLEKSKDLTYLFNVNQNKKTLIRINKLSDLMDTMTQQALVRFTNRPDEISNKELMDGLKTIQDLIERGQKQAAGVQEQPAPFIQINQQTNSVNVGSDAKTLNRDSRERVKNVVMDLIKGITGGPGTTVNLNQSEEIIDAEVVEEADTND